MNNISLTIDGKKISAPAGKKLLWAALDNGIYVPNLCTTKDKPEPEAACRLCWVEIEGQQEPVTACTVDVNDGMVVNTKGEKALALVRAGFDLLMASHALDCAHCPANGKCELQKIAKVLKCSLKPRNLRLLLKDLPIDYSSPLFAYDPNKCVLCGRCVWECKKHNEKAVLGFAYRGFERRLTTFADEPIGIDRCLNCSNCVKVCPTGALSLNNNSKLKTENSKP
jgi:bidirectional [NiFe] hydrogenase diaphorase subunit